MALPVIGNVDPSASPMPTFRCWDEWNGTEDDAKDVRAWDPERAAEAFAERRWSEDYPEQQGVCVRDGEGKVHRFVVRAEQVMTFTARLVEEQK